MVKAYRSVPISRRRVLAGSALAAGGVLAAPLLGACDAGTSKSGGAVTLTVMYKNNELTKEQIADFEAKNAGIKIDFVEFDTTRLNAMLASGSPPDFVRGAAVGSANTNARGLATNLDPYLDKSSVLKKSDLLGVNDSFRWDGKQIGRGPYYGITKDWSQDATLWYNKALFDAAKVPHLSASEPVTYDQLLDIGKRLTVKAGGKTQVYGLGLEWAWNLWGPISMMIVQQGATLYNADLTQTDLTTAAAKRALQWYVDFAQAGVGPTSLDPVPDGADLSTFMAKRMAITQDGYWYGGNFAADDALKTVKMAPAPTMGDTRANPTYGGQGWWIPAKAKNKDAAWKLMEYYMAGPPAEGRASSGWGLPGLKSLMDKLPQDQPFQQAAYTTAQNELQFNVPLPDSPYIATEMLNTTIDKYLQRAIKKELTVDEATAALTDELNDALQQGKDQIG